MSRFRMLLTMVCLIGLALVTSGVEARTIGLIDADQTDELQASLDFGYGQAPFASDGTTGDSDLKGYFFGPRLEYSVSPEFQIYATGGQVSYKFGEEDIEDGTAIGGGIQYVFEENDDLSYKLVGSYMSHSDEEFENDSSKTLEVNDDWQAGLLISRSIDMGKGFTELNQTHAFLGLYYSNRTVDVTDSGNTTEFEYDRMEGLHITGGSRIQVDETFTIEIEGEAGSTIGGTARIHLKL